MESEEQVVERAIAKLPEKGIFEKEGRIYRVFTLYPRNKWRPFEDSRWKGKEAYPMGSDPGGNIFLRVCDGTVRYWEVDSGRDEILAQSVRRFLGDLKTTEFLD
jgi:hypothetical protein